MTKRYLHIPTESGDVEILEDELATITNAEDLEIQELDRLFAEGVEAMEGAEGRAQECQIEPNLSLKGLTPESWLCVDCGVNTSPGMSTRVELEKAIAALGDAWDNGDAGVTQSLTSQSEVYTVRDRVWQAAGMEPMGGCLCIGCLEKRLGRLLRPKDFKRNSPFNSPVIPGTPRLLKRRGVPRSVRRRAS